MGAPHLDHCLRVPGAAAAGPCLGTVAGMVSPCRPGRLLQLAASGGSCARGSGPLAMQATDNSDTGPDAAPSDDLDKVSGRKWAENAHSYPAY